MSAEPAVEVRDQRSSAIEAAPTLTNAQLTQEFILLKRQNIEMSNHIQNLLARLGKLDRDVRAVAHQRR